VVQPFIFLSIGELISNPRQYIFHNPGLQFMFIFTEEILLSLQ